MPSYEVINSTSTGRKTKTAQLDCGFVADKLDWNHNVKPVRCVRLGKQSPTVLVSIWCILAYPLSTRLLATMPQANHTCSFFSVVVDDWMRFRYINSVEKEVTGSSSLWCQGSAVNSPKWGSARRSAGQDEVEGHTHEFHCQKRSLNIAPNQVSQSTS